MDSQQPCMSQPDFQADADALFAPFRIGTLPLSNRLAVAPMTRVSASEEGLPTIRMAGYYSGFARGGFGLVITEGLYTDQAFSQGYLFQPGLANDAHREGWRPLVASVQAQGAGFIAQLMHAGALSQDNRYSHVTRGPSALRPKGRQMAFYRGSGDYAVPEAMTEREIADAVAGFARAAVRARDAGFDGVEIHAANGYLLDQFLSEGINLRDDVYGGDAAARVRLTADVVAAVRGAVGFEFVVGVRISQSKVNDFTHKWRGGEAEAEMIFSELARLPIDYLHTTEFEAWRPAFDTGPSLAALAKKHARVPVIANGSLHDVARAAGMLERGEADAISLGRGALTHADWPARVRNGAGLDAFDPGILSPIADLKNAERHRAQGVLHTAGAG